MIFFLTTCFNRATIGSKHCLQLTLLVQALTLAGDDLARNCVYVVSRLFERLVIASAPGTVARGTQSEPTNSASINRKSKINVHFLDKIFKTCCISCS
jgi:hypothetical protein